MVRVRFAPSPTGYLHVGGLRTALYNYLFAKQQGGTFVLRIEDTDRTRLVEGAVENLIDALNWAGVSFDEGPGKDGGYGPYIQSERLEIYQRHAQQLLDQGDAYYAFDTADELTKMRRRQEADKLPTKYDRLAMRNQFTMSPDAVSAALLGDYVVRLKVPAGEEVAFDDLVRDRVSFQSDVIDDQVLLKSDGYPTYHLANVVDDHLMAITHVIRGEEWLPSVPKHLLLYRAFGWTAPVMAHLPLLLNPDRSKLSKRQGDVSVEDYRAKGYLPEALDNFVALLGWHPSDERELFTLAELADAFQLNRVSKAGAVFDIAKLDWLNTQYLRLLPAADLRAKLESVLDAANFTGAERHDAAYLDLVIELMRERVRKVEEFYSFSHYFFRDPTGYDPTGVEKRWKPDETGNLIVALRDRLADLPDFEPTAIETALRHTAEANGVGAGALIHPARLALSGETQGPGLFELIAALGRDRVVRRLARAVETLG